MAKALSVSPSFLKNVFAGRRSFDLKLKHKLSKAMRLSDSEDRFLGIMILRDQTEEAELKKYFDDVLWTFRSQNVRFEDSSPFAKASTDPGTLANPLEHLVLSLIDLKGFKPMGKWMKAALCDPEISEKELEIALRNLCETGAVSESHGKYRVLKKVVHTPDPFRPETFKIYRKGLRQIDHALEDIPRFKPCAFFMAELTIDEDARLQILKTLDRCREDIMRIAENCKDPTEVLCVSNNAITLAKSV